MSRIDTPLEDGATIIVDVTCSVELDVSQGNTLRVLSNQPLAVVPINNVVRIGETNTDKLHVQASGERSIAIGGSSFGSISTGDGYDVTMPSHVSQGILMRVPASATVQIVNATEVIANNIPYVDLRENKS